MPTPQEVTVQAIRDTHAAGAALESVLIWALRSNLYPINLLEVDHILSEHKVEIQNRIAEVREHISTIDG